tara:strand:- start:136 stop:336 length:201 start_codon:yes stop_codon:yes gene_type:complete
MVAQSIDGGLRHVERQNQQSQLHKVLQVPQVGASDFGLVEVQVCQVVELAEFGQVMLVEWPSTEFD